PEPDRRLTRLTHGGPRNGPPYPPALARAPGDTGRGSTTGTHGVLVPRARPATVRGLPRLPAARGPAAVVHERAARSPVARLRRRRALHTPARRHALSRQPGEHGLLHDRQHAPDPRHPARARSRAQPRRPPDRAARCVLLSVHAVGRDGRADVAVAAGPRRRAFQLLPARGGRAGPVVARGSVDGDVGDHRDDRVVGDRVLPRDLSRGASGHPARPLRSGRPRRRRQRSTFLGDHAAAAASRAALRRRDAHHRLLPALRAGLRPHRRRPGRCHADGRAASTRPRSRTSSSSAPRRPWRGSCSPSSWSSRSSSFGCSAVIRNTDVRRRVDGARVVLTAALLALAVLWLLPIVWVVVTSLKTTAEIVKVPPERV